MRSRFTDKVSNTNYVFIIFQDLVKVIWRVDGNVFFNWQRIGDSEMLNVSFSALNAFETLSENEGF